MMPDFSQRAAEKAIEAFSLRMRHRHGIPAQTSMQEAVAIALAHGDHVAAMLSDDRRLMTIAAGFGGGSGRNSADHETQQAIALLAAMDTLADAAFPPKPVESPATESEYEAWRRTKGARGPSRQRLLKDAEQNAEVRGDFAFRAVFLIGPDEGPVRVGVSKKPADQLRLVNRHCLLTSHIGFEGYAKSNAKAHRVVHAVIDYAKTRGLRHPRKDDVLMVPMTAAIAVVHRIAAQLHIPLLTKDEKNKAIVEFERMRTRGSGLWPSSCEAEGRVREKARRE